MLALAQKCITLLNGMQNARVCLVALLLQALLQCALHALQRCCVLHRALPLLMADKMQTARPLVEASA